ncbi:MAG: TlpA family protein disulfide reductase [Bacteroidales bacterium]|nr:TlpA family protein disulfide reductase [Bacteroidales bacterium]
MKRLFLIIAAAILSVAAWCQTPQTSVLKVLPKGEFSQENASFGDFVGKGNYALVDFWASWCGPCRKETPNVVAVYEKYKDKGLVVLGVPVNDKLDDTKKAIGELGITYPQLLDPSMQLARQYGVRAIPHLVLLGPDGRLVAEGLRGSAIEEAVAKVLK